MPDESFVEADAVDFTELLQKPMDSWRPPTTLPAGKHFYGKISGWEFGRSTVKKTGFAKVNIQPTDPGEDCSPEDLEGIVLSEVREPNYQFWITPKAMYMLTDFLCSLGFDPKGNADEHIRDSKGCRVLFSGVHTDSGRVDANGKPIVYYNITTLVGA